MTQEAFDKIVDEGQEAEGASGSEPAQRPRSAALSIGVGVPPLWHQTARKKALAGKNRRSRERAISYFVAGDCTERGRPVKALRFAPTATRRKGRGLD
jgi:hypothetical protein